MISLTLAEKCYLVAVHGDIPMRRRQPLFSFAAYSPHAGILLGRIAIGRFDDGRILVREKPSYFQKQGEFDDEKR